MIGGTKVYASDGSQVMCSAIPVAALRWGVRGEEMGCASQACCWVTDRNSAPHPVCRMHEAVYVERSGRDDGGVARREIEQRWRWAR